MCHDDSGTTDLQRSPSSAVPDMPRSPILRTKSPVTGSNLYSKLSTCHDTAERPHPNIRYILQGQERI